MTEIRACEQCGGAFTPRREHARFCSAACRIAWDGEHLRDPAAELRALQWSVTALNDTAQRLPRVEASDHGRGFAVIGEAVWRVTIVDATLVRYYPEAYDGVLSGQPPADRKLIEGTLAGLRFVRNQMGQQIDPVDFIQPQPPQPEPSEGSVASWTWKPVCPPALASLSARGQEWEMQRYRAYQAQLSGCRVGVIFGRVAAFLGLAADQATGAHATGARNT